MENNTNSTTSYNFYMDVTVTVAWGSLVVYGLIANLLIVIGILRNKHMRSSTSYWLITHLSICDMVMLAITGIHILPATILHDNFVTIANFRNVAAIFAYNTVWYTSVLSLALMAVNRLTSITYPSDHLKWFSGRKTVGYLMALYTVGLTVSLPTLMSCCRMVYDHNNYKTIYEDETTPHLYVDLAVNSLSLTLMVICYGWLVVAVRNSRKRLENHRRTSNSAEYTQIKRQSDMADKRNSQNAKRRDIRLGIQFSIVSVVFLVTFVTWQIYEKFANSRWLYACMTSLFMVNNSTNPTVYFIFNTNLRSEIVHLGRSFVRKSPSNDSRRNPTVPTRLTVNIPT